MSEKVVIFVRRRKNRKRKPIRPRPPLKLAAGERDKPQEEQRRAA